MKWNEIEIWKKVLTSESTEIVNGQNGPFEYKRLLTATIELIGERSKRMVPELDGHIDIVGPRVHNCFQLANELLFVDGRLEYLAPVPSVVGHLGEQVDEKADGQKDNARVRMVEHLSDQIDTEMTEYDCSNLRQLAQIEQQLESFDEHVGVGFVEYD
mgnify:CR=1 FL=1